VRRFLQHLGHSAYALIEVVRQVVGKFLLHSRDLLRAATCCFTNSISQVPYCLGPRGCRSLRYIGGRMPCIRHPRCAVLNGAGSPLSSTRDCCTTSLLCGLRIAVDILCHYLLQSLLMKPDLDAK
jgi:hypothetical protein